MSQNFERAFGWTVDQRPAVILLMLALTATALIGYIGPERVISAFRPAAEQEEAAPPSTAPSRPRRSSNVEPISLTDSDVVLVVQSDSFFTPDGAAALRHIVKSLEAQDHVQSVFWMDEVPPLNLFGLREPLFPRTNASLRQFEQASEKAQKHPLVGGQLLSDDGRTLLMLIKLNWLFVESDEAATQGIKQIAEQAAADYPNVQFSFQLTGRTPMYLAYRQSQQQNQRRFLIIGVSMVVIMATILFRGFNAVLVVALGPALGVFWTLGLLRYFDYQENPFNDVVLPVLLGMVGLTDGVHLMVEIRRRRAAGLSERDAARAGIAKVGLACFLTSLTTAIGFGSLGLAHHEVVQEFGWSCVIGVIATFLAVLTTIPLACSTWLGRSVHHGHDDGMIDRFLSPIHLIIEAVLRHARPVSYFAIISTAVLIGISCLLEPDERMTNVLPRGAEPIEAIAHMDKAFGGLEQAQVRVEWSKKVPADSPEILTSISKVNELLEKEELIGHPLSIRNLVEALPGEGPASERMSMIELLPPQLKAAFYTPDERRARVNFRVQDLGIAQYGPVFERVEQGLTQLHRQHPEFVFHLDGTAVWRWRNLYQIVVDLVTSLGSASVIIFGVLMIAYRSVRLGLIAVIPNFFPLAFTGACLYFSGDALEIASVCAFTVCLGIAVDDTIHFLTRYQEERATAGNDEAIRRAFTGTGAAMIMTTLVLVVGFATVVFSGMREQRIFASMAIITLTAALLADLTFLPAMLSCFGNRGKNREEEKTRISRESISTS